MPAMVAEAALPSSSSSGSAIWSRRRDEITFNHLHKVLNLSHLSKLARRNNTASRIDEVDKLRIVFLAMEDAIEVLIKLADRLHNMRTFDSLPKIKQLCFAKETLEIFAPLANQLGIMNWKEQLENLCFKYLRNCHPTFSSSTTEI